MARGLAEPTGDEKMLQAAYVFGRGFSGGGGIGGRGGWRQAPAERPAIIQ